jgi:protein-tyrosine phosphatase
MGCMLQINRGSLLGRYGNSAQQTAVDLVSRGLATVVATDAHSPVTRVPKLRDVQKLLMEEFSPEVAKTLLQENPRRILQNKSPLPVQPAWFL